MCKGKGNVTDAGSARKIYFNLVLFHFWSQLYFYWSIVFISN